MIPRRTFIVGLGAAASWPLTARGQAHDVPTVGFLALGSPGTVSSDGIVRSFLQGLKDAGYVDGRNVAIEYRWAEFQDDHLPALAADLVARRVSVIAALGNPAPAIVARAATATIPVIFANAGDPVALGLVTNLSKPDRNLTGVTSLNVEVGPKRLELLHEIVPAAASLAVLVNPTSPVTAPLLRDLDTAARTLGVTLHVLNASNDPEIDSAFEATLRLHAGGLVIGPDAFFNSRLERLGSLTVHQAVPTIYSRREFTAAGGLMSYGGEFAEAFSLAGFYTGRILMGAKPADLPVQQATKIELVINLKTARALGIAVPLSLLGRADEVIE